MARLPGWLVRLLRRRVPAGTGPRRGPGGRGTDGGAGVREPRRPRPSPSGAAAHAEPEEEQVL